MPRYIKKKPNYHQNDGKPGVVYILENVYFKGMDIYKIGQSTRSGKQRALDLNNEATTHMPAGGYSCIFEIKTMDCGIAEKRVFDKLSAFKNVGRKKQEFFTLSKEELAYAQDTIRDTCREVDEKYNNKIEEDKKEAARILEQQRIAQQAQEAQRAKETADRKKEEAEKARADAEEKQQAEKIIPPVSQSGTHYKAVQAPQPVKRQGNISWGEIVIWLLVVVFAFRQCDTHTPTSPAKYAPIPEVALTKNTNSAGTEIPANKTMIEPVPSHPETRTNVLPTRPQDAGEHSTKSRYYPTHKKSTAPSPLEILEPPTISLPENAHAYYDGHNWGFECNYGYVRVGDACVIYVPPRHEIEPVEKSVPVAVREGIMKEPPVKQNYKRLDCPVGAQQVGDKCVDYRRPFWETQ
jgi:hypothetical protein